MCRYQCPLGEGGGEGAVLWTLADHLGTIRDIATHDNATDATTIINHRIYDSYGNLKSETNASIDEIFGFTGRLFDEITGLQNNLFRWYDPRAGRWIAEDPIAFSGGDTNLSRYVGNSPTNYRDPIGLMDFTPFDFPSATAPPADSSPLTGPQKNRILGEDQWTDGTGIEPASGGWWSVVGRIKGDILIFWQ